MHCLPGIGFMCTEIAFLNGQDHDACYKFSVLKDRIYLLLGPEEMEEWSSSLQIVAKKNLLLYLVHITMLLAYTSTGKCVGAATTELKVANLVVCQRGSA